MAWSLHLIPISMSRARFVLSLDCELLWGSYRAGGLEKFPYLNLKDCYRHYYDQLLSLLDRYKIKATFAFVGGIAFSQSEFKEIVGKLDGFDYKNHLDTILNLSNYHPSHWHDIEIIKKVINSNFEHEIGSHSLIHLPFNIILDPKTAKTELHLSHKILSKLTQKPINTFIFPENQIYHLEELKKSSFRIYRGKDDSWYKKLPLKRLLHFLDQFLPLAPRSVSLQVDQYGNYCLPGSLMLFAYDGVRCFIPDWIRFLKIKRGIDRAIAERKIFHLWFHPWNLGSSPRMKVVLEKVFSYVSEKCKEGVLSVSTMEGVLDP